LYLRSEEQLWGSDGTPMKTRSLGTVDPYELTNAGGTLFFRGPEGLWKSNGTKAGTKLVAEASEPSQLTNVSGTLFFTTLQDGWQGMLLSDGTSAGTYGWRGWNTAYGSATNLTSVAGRLHYTYNGYLWYVIVCPQPECPESSGAWDLPVTPYDQPEKAAYGARNLTNVAGTLYYSASDFDAAKGTELWRYVP
jgi:ELWxxDGT repeat protein